MTVSNNSVINQTIKFIFAVKILKHFISKFHSKRAIKISKNQKQIFNGLTISSPLAIFSRRYHLLVRSTNTLNNCPPGFRILLVKCFGFVL